MATIALKERPAVRAQPQVARKQKRTFIAKPVRGVIDFKALRRSIVARFPNTIAHLAK
jgi:hypothetical protein